MTWIHPLAAETEEPADILGGKAHGLVVLLRLGLPVPPGFVIGTGACRAFLADGRLPDGLDAELAAAVAELEAATGRPPAVSVRSGGRESMPGMMTTILNLPVRQVEPAVVEVLSSWDTPRARTYRELHGIPHHLGTAVTVQAMVFGNRDHHSGSGVAFSRNPNTGEHAPFGEVLFGRQGDDVVSGRSLTRPLHELADREPAVRAGLLDALHRVEDHYRDACHLEFTFEAGALWLLQVRPGRFAGDAAVRVATDLADEGVIGRGEALLRVSPRQLQHARIPASPRSTRPTCSPGASVPARALPWAGSRPPPTTRPGWSRTARSSWSAWRPPRSTCTAWPPPPASPPPVAGRPATPPWSRGRWANRPSWASPT
jgi:pyruvate, orthophosphate dikinase